MTPAPLQVDVLELGAFQTNCYVLGHGNGCWVVDPGMGPAPLLELLRRRSRNPERILLTHGHGNHVAGLGQMKAAFPQARVCCPAADSFMLADPQANLSAMFGLAIVCPPAEELLLPGAEMAMGELTWRALDTSGHTPGGMSFYCPQAGIVVTGDALFAGSIGRTDLPGASQDRLIENIRTHLMSLPGATKVLPGHGPQTTIEQERQFNPYLAAGRQE